jgi:hypothetical protein
MNLKLSHKKTLLTSHTYQKKISALHRLTLRLQSRTYNIKEGTHTLDKPMEKVIMDSIMVKEMEEIDNYTIYDKYLFIRNLMIHLALFH